MAKLLNLWRSVRASLWFVPGLMVCMAVVLAIVLIDLDGRIGDKALLHWPRVFGAGAAGSRGLLATVAGSMITVAGVVFSITLVALSLTSSQYTARVLRNFMDDRTNQSVLGMFVAIFAYCLVVLRTIRDGEETAFVPSVAVLGGVVLAFVGIGYLIFFIHHIATTIQASHILARIAEDTVRRMDRLFPKGVESESVETTDVETILTQLKPRLQIVPSSRMGYIQGVQLQTLQAIACKEKMVIRMEHRVGDFVIEGSPLATLLAPNELQPEVLEKVCQAYTINRQRTPDQDTSFGIRQIVDVALKALSPGINDTTTAVLAVDYLTAITARLCDRLIEKPHQFVKGDLRVIIRGPTFGGFVAESFDQIRQNASGNVAVLSRLSDALFTLESRTHGPIRRKILLHQTQALDEVVRRTIPSEFDRGPVEARTAHLMERLNRAIN